MKYEHLIVLQALAFILGGGLLGFFSSWLGLGSYARMVKAVKKARARTITVKESVATFARIAFWFLWLGGLVFISGLNVYFVIGLLLGLYSGLEVGKELIDRELEFLANSLT